MKQRDEKLLIGLMLTVYVVVVVRTAWVSEDSYITFRTVDNFVNGYGLTWNVAERVQAYTHPLWMFVISAAYFITREIFFTSVLVSLVVSMLTVLLVGFKFAFSPAAAVIGIAVLTLSRSFIDYSTSGLENPLTHLLLALFLLVYLQSVPSPRNLFILAFLAALGVLNRQDTILLFLPALAYAFWRLRSTKALAVIALGFLPFLLWECFSLFYYGFPFPNTAYAKLNTGISDAELMAQGVFYYLNSLNGDLLTLVVIAISICAVIIRKSWSRLPIVLGICLYLVYVVKIGGDFMSGRFFSAPLLLAVIMLSEWPLEFRRFTWLPVFLVLCSIGLISPRSPLVSDADYGLNGNMLKDDNGIADERSFYYPFAGLLRAVRSQELPNHAWVAEGRLYRERGPAVISVGNVGYLGFYAGPAVYIVDVLGLADPLLSRLPASRNSAWRIGHFRRIIPNGYRKTLMMGVNVLQDKNLAAYYDKLTLITRGDLWSADRLGEIWNMNTGKYDYLINRSTYRYPELQHVKLSGITQPTAEGTPWDAPDNARFSESGIQVELEQPYHVKRIELSLAANASYQLVYLFRDSELATQMLWAHSQTADGMSVFFVEAPAAIATIGYDKLWLLPARGDGHYSLGHVRMIESQ